MIDNVRRRRTLVATAGFLASAASCVTARAQEPVECNARLAAPSRDSVALRVVLRVHAFDRAHDLPAWYQEDFGESVRGALVLPTPFAMDTYSTSADTISRRTAHLVVTGAYRAVLTRAGHIVGLQITGGARNVAFDQALLSAVTSLDTANALAALSEAGIRNADVLIRITVETRNPDDAAVRTLSEVMVSDRIRRDKWMPATALADTGTATPLFAFRAPLRDVTQGGRQIPGHGNLRYPDELRRQYMDGDVWTSFVVGADGLTELNSFQVLSATRAEFAQAVLNAAPAFLFAPLMLEGCAVRWVVQEPFTFRIR